MNWNVYLSDCISLSVFCFCDCPFISLNLWGPYMPCGIQLLMSSMAFNDLTLNNVEIRLLQADIILSLYQKSDFRPLSKFDGVTIPQYIHCRFFFRNRNPKRSRRSCFLRKGQNYGGLRGERKGCMRFSQRQRKKSRRVRWSTRNKSGSVCWSTRKKSRRESKTSREIRASWDGDLHPNGSRKLLQAAPSNKIYNTIFFFRVI